jgi:hypothetical protein
VIKVLAGDGSKIGLTMPKRTTKSQMMNKANGPRTGNMRSPQLVLPPVGGPLAVEAMDEVQGVFDETVSVIHQPR